MQIRVMAETKSQGHKIKVQVSGTQGPDSIPSLRLRQLHLVVAALHREILALLSMQLRELLRLVPSTVDAHMPTTWIPDTLSNAF